jgi:GTP-binding protein
MNKLQLYKVALVGRPNVGKSTLFNRLIGKKRAITDPTPGVTRDPLEARWNLPGGDAILVDTGGFQVKGQEIDHLVTQKTLAKCQESDLILLVMDVRTITPEDEEFIEKLRGFAHKILLVVNKVDTEDHQEEIWNYYSLGFESLVGISATHGRGIDELKTLVAQRIFSGSLEAPEPGPDLKLAILGKPNAGKSTLCNRLTKSENSIVSEIPGTTRDVVEGEFPFKGKSIRVLDTAGIRRKKKVNENVEYYSVNRAIKTIEEADVVLLVIDAQEGLSDQDKKIANLVVREGKGIILALNKWDLMEDVPNRLESYKDRIAFLFPILDFAPVFPLSAKEGKGVTEILNMALRVKQELGQRIETGVLNAKLKNWIEDNPEPNVKGKMYKIKYITQVSAAPVRFVGFVNREKNFPGFYKGYLENRIRKDLGFFHVPISLELQSKS